MNADEKNKLYSWYLSSAFLQKTLFEIFHFYVNLIKIAMPLVCASFFVDIYAN